MDGLDLSGFGAAADDIACSIDRKRVAEAPQDSEVQLRPLQKMEAVGRLAGGIAHDFNNFLTVIMRRSNLLLLNLPKDHPHRKSLENIEQTTPERGKVRIDRGQVEQVLVNLVVNARDAMPAGGRIAIAVSEVELDEGEAARAAGISAGRYIVLAVADTGTGMDEHTKARIFEPFFTTKEPGKGTR